MKKYITVLILFLSACLEEEEHPAPLIESASAPIELESSSESSGPAERLPDGKPDRPTSTDESSSGGSEDVTGDTSSESGDESGSSSSGM